MRKEPVPSLERLRNEDCNIGLNVYQQLLQKPPNAGVVIAPGRGLGVPPSPEQQEHAMAEFAQKCQSDLAGRARRVIVRCWTDSPDANTFRSCNDRF